MGKKLVCARARSNKPIVEDFIHLGLLPGNEGEVTKYSNVDMDIL